MGYRLFHAEDPEVARNHATRCRLYGIIIGILGFAAVYYFVNLRDSKPHVPTEIIEMRSRGPGGSYRFHEKNGPLQEGEEKPMKKESLDDRAKDE